MYGFRARGEHGVFQIDGEHQAFCLRDKRTVNLTGGYQQNDLSAIIGRNNNSGLAPVGGDIIFVKTDLNVNVTTGAGGYILYQPPGSGSGIATIYTFNAANKTAQPSARYGLRVRNPTTGLVVYSSAWKSLNLTHSDVTDADINGRVVSSLNSMAACVSSPYVRTEQTAQYERYYERFFNTQGNALRITEQFSYAYDQPGGWGVGKPTATSFIMMADITLL